MTAAEQGELDAPFAQWFLGGLPSDHVEASPMGTSPKHVHVERLEAFVFAGKVCMFAAVF